MSEKEINLNFEKFNHVMPHLARVFFFFKKKKNIFCKPSISRNKKNNIIVPSPILEGNASAIQKAKR
jgi:hypothetical protein